VLAGFGRKSAEAGVVVESVVDYWRDGTTIEARRDTRAQDGELLSHEIDGDGDGAFEQTARFSYDSAGCATEAQIVDGERECVLGCGTCPDPAFFGPLETCPLRCP
jgi:hypothetical protein